jgi:endonuclease/exonuclease/phosphatase family metal-dependent hydrolase
MQYNTENFFDTQHDQGTLDYTFLPLSIKKILPDHRSNCLSMTSDFYRNECLKLDWTDEKLQKKIQNVSKVVKSFDEIGQGPDILILQEIENAEVLKKLIQTGLTGTGLVYGAILEGDDSRGIDVAVVSKFPMTKTKRHPLVMNGEVLDTRGILEVHMRIELKTVVVFANHWPSQNHPVSQRIASAKLLEKQAALTRGDLVIAAGDFNTISKDIPSPFDFMLSFSDAEEYARRKNPDVWPGTNYYRGQWSSLDKIFIHNSSTVTPNYESFRILALPFMMNVSSSTGRPYPKRFNHSKGEGYSDHLPVCLEVTL